MLNATLCLALAICTFAALTPNYLLNSGFESSSNTTGSDAENWIAWWEETPKPPSGFDYAYKPNWNRELLSNGAAAALVYAEDSSLRVYNSWDPWHAGVRQTVNVPTGERLRLTAYARVWAASEGWPAPSDEAVNVRVQVGLDPTGGDDALSPNIIWSDPITPHNRWQAVSVEASSTNGTITAYLSANYRGDSRQFMMAFWDEATLTPATAWLTNTLYLPLILN